MVSGMIANLKSRSPIKKICIFENVTISFTPMVYSLEWVMSLPHTKVPNSEKWN